MRILFNTIKSDNIVNINVLYSLENKISKHAECKWVGEGWEDHVPGETIDQSIRRLYGNDHPDWVISNRANIEKYREITSSGNKNNRSYKMIMTLADLHVHPEKWVKTANIGFDAALMRYMYSPYVKKELFGIYKYYIKFDPNYYQNNLETNNLHFPWFTDSNIYGLSDEKDFDVIFLGSSGRKVYPLRNRIVRELPSLSKVNNWRYLLRGRPPGATHQRNIPDLISKGFIVGEKYAEVLARTKIFIFGSSIFRYPLSKFFEVMGSGALVLADEPQSAEELHFRSGENYVEINQDNWKEKLEYYLEDDQERERIARRGYETAMKYHSTEVRAKQLINFLKSMDCS